MTRSRRLRKRGARGRSTAGVASTGRPQAASSPNLPVPWWEQQKQQQGQGQAQARRSQDDELSADMHHRIFMEGYNNAISDYDRNKARIYEEARQRAFREAARGPYLAVVRQAGYREGYDVGFREGERAGVMKAAEVDQFFTYSDVENARRDGFAEGVFAGRTQAKANEKARRGEPESFDRNKLIDEMLDQCKIIAESNPNMAPGVKAVRHRIKKLAQK